MPITDLTGYTWVGNSTITSAFMQSSYLLSFTSNNKNFNQLTYDASPDGFFLEYTTFPSPINAYDFDTNQWASEAYKTITINGGTDAINANLIAWLEANGTLTAPIQANTYEITHSLTNLTHGNITLQITPDTGYTYPSTLTVTNGTLVSYDNTTGVAVIRGDDTTTISAECVEAVQPPVKGDIIHFDALGNGTQKRFRVINVIEGNTVKLLGLDDLGNSVYNASSRTIAFDNGSKYQNYEGSDLDTYLNTTYYNSLSNAVKSAIVDETLVQSCYSIATGQSSSATFNIKRLDNATVYAYTRTTQRTVGLRHVHAIELDEIKSYFNASTGDLIQGTTINELFFEQTAAISKYAWCASAYAVYSNYAFNFYGRYGYLNFDTCNDTRIVRPAFKINLSTIDYTIE